MSNFFFAKNLPAALQDLDKKSLQDLESYLERRVLPNGERCLRSHSEIIRNVLKAKRENRFVSIANSSLDEMIFETDQDETLSERDFYRGNFSCSTPLRDMYPKSNQLYVQDSYESSVSFTSTVPTDTSFYDARSISTQTSLTQHSQNYSPESPSPENQNGVEVYRSPIGYVESLVEAIAAYHAEWYVFSCLSDLFVFHIKNDLF